jgi:hypothetical protein
MDYTALHPRRRILHSHGCENLRPNVRWLMVYREASGHVFNITEWVSQGLRLASADYTALYTRRYKSSIIKFYEL